MISFSKLLWAAFLLFFLSTPSWAGEIILEVESTVRATGRNLDVQFRISNRGDELADDVSLQASLRDQKRTTWVDGEILPGKSREAGLGFELPPNARGTFPIFITLAYRSLGGTPFSVAALAVARTKDAQKPGLLMHLQGDGNIHENQIMVRLDDPSSSPREIILTCHIPDDLMVLERQKKVRLEAGTASAPFHIRNRKGTAGSRYGIFITAEYESEGIHYLVYSSHILPIKGVSAVEEGLGRIRELLYFIITLIVLVAVVAAVFSPKSRAVFRRSFQEKRWPGLTLDLILLLLVESFILSHIGIQHLLTETVTTGGDAASHYYTLHYLRHELLPAGRISGWTPGNYAGFPLLQYYFPLPFLIMCLLDSVLPLQAAFKLVTILGTFLLPVAGYLMLRFVRCPFPGPGIGAALALPFLFNTGQSMWGGNLLSTLAGEFSYSLGMALAVIFLGTLYRGCRENRFVILNAVLVFLVGFSHGYALLFVEALSLFFLLTPRGFLKRLGYLARVYALGFCLLAFWLVPLLAYSKYTIPYSDVWQIRSINEIAPDILLPFFIAAGVGGAGILAGQIRRSDDGRALRVLGFLCFGILMSGVMFVLAPRIGLVDIRYVPFAQLTVCLLAGLGLGWLGSRLHQWGLAWVYLLAVVGATVAWTDSRVNQVPEWAKWDYEGFEAKAFWPLFREINATLRGTFQDPRVVFEHSSEHNLFGSMRAFESLPLFAGRATLEGLYMQASISSPFVFYIQSEVSKQKSTPFHQYNYTDMDFDRARTHLDMFNVRELILRSPEAKAAVRSAAGYRLHKTLGDYEIWQTGSHEGRYVVPLKNEPVLLVTRDWKTDSFLWFINPEHRPGVHLVFAENLSLRETNLFKTGADSLKSLPRIPIDTAGCRVEETIRNDEIVVDTNWINKPLLVKVSFHPNWRVEGADRIYLVSPSFMLVFPREKRVRLYYSKGMPEHAGMALTGLGLLVLLLNLPLPRRRGKTAWGLLLGHFGPVESPFLRLKWNPGNRQRFVLLACGIGIAAFCIGWFSYHSYRNEPTRLFNRAIKLKDGGRHREAREEFRLVITGVAPTSRLSEESAYYIAICHYLQGDDPAAIRAFEELIHNYPYGRRTQEAHYHVGLCLFRSGEEQKGIERMKRLLKKYPGTMWAGFAGDRLREHHAIDGGAPDGDINAQGTENTERRMGLAIRLFNEERLDEAKSLFEDIGRNHPEFEGAPQALACLALIYFKQDKYSDTIRYYRQIIERYPANRLVPEAYYHIGRSFEMLGDWKKAEEAYATAKEAFPETPFGKRAEDRLRAMSRVNK